MKNRSVILWVVAALLTIGAAVYQRVTGPTYPLSGEVAVGGTRIAYRLNRTEEQKSAAVEIPAEDAGITGRLEWRRFKTGDPWAVVPMERAASLLKAELPMQPPAGKLEYRVVLEKGGESATVPRGDPAVIRFKGNVPSWVLIPHVLVMFLAMLFSTRAGLEFLSSDPQVKKLALWTIGLLGLGGMILGPVMQKYAFDAYWTGWPFGTDLTDNKTAVALIAWVAAYWFGRRSSRPGRWALGAAIVLFIVYLIPHSLLGSELDYSKEGGRPAAAGPPAR